MDSSSFNQPDFGIEPLCQADREIYPSVIYTQEADSNVGACNLLEAVQASTAQGLPFVIDVDTDPDGVTRAVVRSSTTDRFESRIHSALINGTAALIDEHMPTEADKDVIGVTLIRGLARGAIAQVIESDDLREGFGSFYSGLRFTSDQENFVNTLFVEASELKFDLLETLVVSGYAVRTVSYGIDLNLPWEITRSWSEMTAEEVFSKHPELDFARLKNEGFRDTTEGIVLEKAYRKYVGQELSRRYNNRQEDITDSGEIIPLPILPLSKFPLVESLFVDEVLMPCPTNWSTFSPSDVTSLILSSDSVKAQRALVTSLKTKPQPELSFVYDGPNDFEKKRGIVRGILKAYRGETDTSRKLEFKDQIIDIIAAYTGNGPIATYVRTELQSTDEYNRFNREGMTFREILSDILVTAIASPDASEMVGRMLPSPERLVSDETDPLNFSQSELQDVLLESLNLVNRESDAGFIELFATKAFGLGLAPKIRNIVDMRIEADVLSSRREVRLARKQWARSNAPFDSQEATELKKAYEYADEDSRRLREKANDVMNEVLLELMDIALIENELSGADAKINNLIRRLHIGASFDMEQLPEIYHSAIKFANKPNVTNSIKSSVLWRFAEHYKYATGKQSARQLTTIIIDGYHLMLGSPNEALVIPDAEVSSGLSALNILASHNVFKQADEAQLLELSRYRYALMDLVHRYIGRQLTSGEFEDPDLRLEGESEVDKRSLQHVESVLRSFKKLESQYEEFIYLEEVKHEPHVYYPWVLKQLVPFWQKMEWEVGPGNKPHSDISRLHGSLRDLIENKLLVNPGQEFDSTFDAVDEGMIDELLLVCYDQMVVPHDMKYNGTVWREGLSFIHVASSMMPSQLLDKIQKKYGADHRLVKYIKQIQSRSKE